MARDFGWGIGVGLDGREAAQQAAQSAMMKMGSNRPTYAFVIFPHELPVEEVQRGLTGVLGNTPVWGFSTARPFSDNGSHPHAVLIALLSASETEIRSRWFPDFSQNSNGVATQMKKAILEWEPVSRGVLITADGVFGDISPVFSAFNGHGLAVAGCLTAGEVRIGKTYQVGGKQAGTGGLAAFAFGDRIRMGVGNGVGWKKIGISFTITRSRGAWIQSLDNGTPAEAFEKIFHYPAREWAFPPLNDVTRMYCLGIESENQKSHLLLRSPIHVEVDGSFRMSVPVHQGSKAHLMVGDIQACTSSIRSACQNALTMLGSARPTFALVFVDIAWSYLYETRPDEIMATLRAEMPDIPVLGGYTFGQIEWNSSRQIAQLQNQTIQVVVLGEVDAV